MKNTTKLTTLHSIDLKTPLKTLADTTKRRAYELDTQSMGKPNYDWAQVEEFRTKIEEDNLEKLRDDSRVDSQKETLSTNLKRPGITSSETFKVAYFGMTNSVRSKLTRADRVKLIDAADKAGMNAVVTPPISDPDPQEAKEIIYSQNDYAERALDSKMFVIPTLSMTKTSPNWVTDVATYIEENFSDEEIPIVATDGFYPLKNATEFQNLRDTTDKLVMVASCRKKIYHDQYGEGEDLEPVSAEVLLASMGADIIGQYFHVGGFSPDEEDTPVKEMDMTLMKGNSMSYRRDLTIADADVISCDCLIHKNLDDDQIIRYFGSQNKLQAAEGIHNEMQVPKAIATLRDYLDNDRFTEFRNEYQDLDDALREIEE